MAPTISHDFSEKKIILFAASGGSKFGRTVEELKVRVAADMQIMKDKLLNGRQTIASINRYMECLKV